MRAGAAIVFGSGLAVVPEGLEVEREVPYARLGWPATDVAGHPNRLLVCRPAGVSASARSLPADARVLLACGRPHLYEGWSEAELRRPVADLAAWGVHRLVLTNAAGGLAADVRPGSALVIDEIVDLQATPEDELVRLGATPPRLAECAVTALHPRLAVRRGRYAAVPGPHYETRAEAAWLAQLADAVGMSTASELRAARAAGLEVAIVSLVVNRSGDTCGHGEVVAAGARLADSLRAGLARVLAACGPQRRA